MPPTSRPHFRKASYAQCGEDLIALFALRDILGIATPTYLDIGANHPQKSSNSYLFYRLGGHGVCVEPDPAVAELFRLKRPRDTCLSVGIGQQCSESDFYVMHPSTLSTFSREDAERSATQAGCRLVKVIQAPLLPINQIIADHLPAGPNFISLDAEGLDVAILQSLNFARYRPQMFCIETLSFVGHRKEPRIFEIMRANGYFAYADTFINTLFLDERAYLAKTGVDPTISRGVWPLSS